MAKTKQNNELSLEQALWNCRVALRGIGSTEKNRDAVISLVFLKFAGDKFEKRKNEIIAEHGDNDFFVNEPSFYLKDNVYFLSEETQWSFIVKNASSNDIAVKIDKAMAKIEEDNEPLCGTMPQNLFSTLGASKQKIKSLIDNVNQISEERFQEEDLIGRVYEYFLQVYAAAGTKDDGEFYTPACIVRLIAELIEPYKGKVYDPCCGSGGMFVQSTKFVENHRGNKKEIAIIGQESNPDTWRLCKMNLAIRGLSPNLGERAASTFTHDQHEDIVVDYIMANPPFNLKDWRGEDQLLNDPRWNGYEVPPKANANYAWILHMISKLDKTDGVAGFLLANGALNESGVEGEIRKELIENDKVEAIIVLPRDMFYTTDISVTLWIINMNKNAKVLNGRHLRKRNKELLFIDLRTWNKNIETYTYDKGKRKKKVVLIDEQIAKVKETYNNWQDVDTSKYKDVPEFCKSVKIEDVAEKNYSLAPSKYIEFIDHDLEINYEEEMTRIQAEMAQLLKDKEKYQTKLKEAFKGIGYDIA